MIIIKEDSAKAILFLLDSVCARMKLRGLLPPLTWSPSLPEGGKVGADFIVSAPYLANIYFIANLNRNNSIKLLLFEQQNYIS